MRTSTMLGGLLAMFAGFALATAAAAQTAPAGFSDMSGNSKIKVKSCGKTSADESWEFGMATDGDWFAFNGVDEFCGTSLPVSTNERKRDLDFDTFGGECDDIEDTIDDLIFDVCGDEQFLESGEFTKARFKLNKKETKAKVHVKGKGTTSESNNVKVRFKVKGDWTID